MLKMKYTLSKILLIIVILHSSCIRINRETDRQQEITYPLQKQRSSSQISFLLVNSFCEDSLGYMWIATLGGLNRYNGYEFMQYLHDAADSTSLMNDFVFSLFIDSSHRLWVGTAEGVNRYDFETNRFIRFSNIFAPVYSFFEDHNQHVWVASNGSSGRIDTLQQKIILSGHAQKVNLYWEDSSLRLWKGLSENQGLAVRKGDQSWEYFTLPDNRRVTCMYSDPQGVWWLGTNAGLILFDPVSGTFKKPPVACSDDAKLSKTQISFIRETEPLKLLIGTTTQGMFQYDIMSQTLLHDEPRNLNPFRSKQLMSCYVDKHENVWIGFYDKGFVVRNKRLDFFNADHELSDIFKDKFVTRVVEDKYGNLWIGTRYDGLYCYTSTGKLTSYHVQNSDFFPANNDFLESLFVDSKDRIWIGFDNWLVVGKISTDGHIGTWERIDLKHVRVVKEDKHGNIWIGGNVFGLYKIDHRKFPAKMQKIYPAQGIASITDICILQSGDVLFSC